MTAIGGQQHELAFWHLDRRIGLELDGRRWIYDEQDIALGEVRVRTNKAEVAIEVDQGEVRLEQVALDRDVYYTNTGILDRASRGQDFEIPADHYFVLGDNSPSSSDSRAWAVARVTLKNGRVINRELNPNDRPWTALSRDDGKHVLYRDEFGVVHKVKRSDIQSREIFGEPQASSRADDPDNNMMEYAGVDPRYQTVRRELILGRAFFIFWPHWRVSFIK